LNEIVFKKKSLNQTQIQVVSATVINWV